MGEPGTVPSLKRFFDRLVRQSLSDLWLASEPVADYLSSLLARFARTEQLYALRSVTGERLETVADMLLEIGRVWEFDRPTFDPFREREIRRHIGDFTLFMTGLFPEHVERRASRSFYVREGKRAYQAVADFERSALRPGARLYAALAADFEGYVGALGYLKRVYLRPVAAASPHAPVLRLLTEW